MNISSRVLQKMGNAIRVVDALLVHVISMRSNKLQIRRHKTNFALAKFFNYMIIALVVGGFICFITDPFGRSIFWYYVGFSIALIGHHTYVARVINVHETCFAHSDAKSRSKLRAAGLFEIGYRFGALSLFALISCVALYDFIHISRNVLQDGWHVGSFMILGGCLIFGYIFLWIVIYRPIVCPIYLAASEPVDEYFRENPIEVLNSTIT